MDFAPQKNSTTALTLTPRETSYLVISSNTCKPNCKLTARQSMAEASGTGLKPPTDHRGNSAEFAFQPLRRGSSSYSPWFSWQPLGSRPLRLWARLRAGPQERLTWLAMLGPSPVSALRRVELRRAG